MELEGEEVSQRGRRGPPFIVGATIQPLPHQPAPHRAVVPLIGAVLPLSQRYCRSSERYCRSEKSSRDLDPARYYRGGKGGTTAPKRYYRPYNRN